MKHMFYKWSLATALLSLLLLNTSNLLAKSQTDKLVEINFSEQLPSDGRLVIGVYANGELDPFAKIIDEQTNSALSEAINKVQFSGEFLSTAVITGPVGTDFTQFLLLGLGVKDELTSLEYQKLGDIAVRHSVKAFGVAVPILLNFSVEASAEVAMGAGLGAYYFDKYFNDLSRHKRQTSLTLLAPNPDSVANLYRQQYRPIVHGVWHARDVSNEPGNVIYPEQFVARWKDYFDDLDNIRIRVLDEDDMRDLNMGAIYAVGKGSERPPRVLIVEYMGGEKGDKPVIMAGKGVTFDAGGISLKNPPNMWNMKFDMSGAASVMGALYGIAGRQAKVNAIAIAGLAENMPSSNAFRPGDVLATMSGRTVSIRSTDAEGRLVLADVVHYAQTKYDPEILINLATLTGSARRALGQDYAAMFTRHDELVDGFIAAGKATTEEVWQLPLNDNHFKAIEHNVADVMNSGPSAPGASAGAAFVGYFVKETTPWVQFDIAGVAYNDDEMTFKGSQGSRSFGVLLLNQYVRDNFEK